MALTAQHVTDADVIEEFTPEQARAHTDRINHSVAVSGNLIVEAYDRRIWKALGYSTWDDYTAAEIGTPDMTAASRAVLAVGLRSAGMSVRAIAAATGASKSTIHRDLEVSHFGTPDEVAQSEPPASVVGVDGKNYPATQPERELAEEPTPTGRPAGEPSNSSATPLAPTESDDRETSAGSLTGSSSVGAPTSPEAERDAAVTAAAREIARTHALFRWKPEELVALNDPDIDAGIRNLMAVISPWWESYKAAKPKGLVVHQGGKQ